MTTQQELAERLEHANSYWLDTDECRRCAAALRFYSPENGTLLEDVRRYAAVCPVPGEMTGPARFELLEIRERIQRAASCSPAKTPSKDEIISLLMRGCRRPTEKEIAGAIHDAIKGGPLPVKDTQASVDARAATRAVLALTTAKPAGDEWQPERERFIGALTPSAETKAAYTGEFKFPISHMDEDGDEATVQMTVPWTTIKEIMAAIKKRAHTGAQPTTAEETLMTHGFRAPHDDGE